MPSIDGEHGIWEWTSTPGVSPTVPPSDKPCDKLTIKYVPLPGTPCREFRLISVVEWTAYDATGNVVGKKPDEIYDGEHIYRYRKRAEVENDGKIWVVDYKSCEGDPFLDGEDRPHDGHRLTIRQAQPTVGWPLMKPGIVKIVKSFEVCVVCLDNGVILDTLRWTSTATRTATSYDEGTIAPPQRSNQPHEGTREAIRKFVKTHTTVSDDDGEEVANWTCPERNTTKHEVPDGFWRAWKPPEEETGFHWLDLDETRVGEGRMASLPAEVLAAARSDVARAAIKFTWCGDQDRSVASLVITPAPTIVARDVAPFLQPNDSRFDNDFAALRGQTITRDLCAALLEQLSNGAGVLTQPPAEVVVTVIANVGRPGAFAFAGSLKPAQLAVMLDRAAPYASSSDLAAMDYISLNMAQRPVLTAQQVPRGCLHPANFFAIVTSLLAALHT
ncbi:MAG: hypothetical protein WEE89_08925 [Gemmatimonadota bacterium]